MIVDGWEQLVLAVSCYEYRLISEILNRMGSALKLINISGEFIKQMGTILCICILFIMFVIL